jgi:hypothetical protein
VHRTIIRIHPDGSSDQTFEAIPVEEQQAELAVRAGLVERLRSDAGGGALHPQALETLGVDTGCAGADLWLFDQSNLAGNELCLFKAASDDMAWLDLGTICRVNLCNGLRRVTWAYAVRSLWAGVDPGSLQSCTSTQCNPALFLNFSTYQEITSVAGGGLNWAFLFTP